MKCYFAHTWAKRHSKKKYKIKKILEDRGLEVIDPFIGEFRILRKYGFKNNEEYWDRPNYKAAREIWVKDLSQIRNSNILLAWVPVTSIGVSAEISYGIEYQTRLRYQDKGKPPEDKRRFLIQIISKKKHPLFAYALQFGNQQFETVKDFEHLHQLRW